MTTREAPTTKITIKFYGPMYRQFERQLNELMLLKDAYIDHMIEGELPNLKNDLKGRVNSAAARRHIAGTLKRMGGASAGMLLAKSIKIRKSTAKSLKRVVDQHNLCRDAFINRLIANLRGSDAWLGVLQLSTKVDKLGYETGVQSGCTSPLKAIEEAMTDPMYYLRAEAESSHRLGLYVIPLPEWLHGFSCVLPDEDVPGTPAYKDMAMLFDDGPATRPAVLQRSQVKAGGRK